MIHYQGIIFELNKGFLYDPIHLDYIYLHQIGEIGLQENGEIFEHKNQCNEITYIVSGEGIIYTEEVMKKVKQGDIHIISKDKKHRIISSPTSKLRYIYIGFDFNQNLVDEETQALVDFYNNTHYEIVQDIGNIRFLLDLVINELYQETTLSNTIFESCIKQILIYIYRNYNSEKPKYYVPAQNALSVGQTVYNIIRYIDSNIFEIKNVKDIANKLGYTSNYISHIFKEKTGESILSYLTKKKIESSIELLKSGKFTITEISQYLNYESSQAFSKVFKKHMGFSPSEIRKSYK